MGEWVIPLRLLEHLAVLIKMRGISKMVVMMLMMIIMKRMSMVHIERKC